VAKDFFPFNTPEEKIEKDNSEEEYQA